MFATGLELLDGTEMVLMVDKTVVVVENDLTVVEVLAVAVVVV